MTPAERLLAAADLLEKRAGEATPGPWAVGSHLDALTPPRTWHLEGIERWRGLANNVGLGEDEATATYIATMHPEVGKVLAAWLRELGEETVADEGDYCEGNGHSTIVKSRRTHELHERVDACTSWFCANVTRGLALADLLLASAS